MKHHKTLVFALLLCSHPVAAQVAVELRALPATSPGDTVTTLPTSQATFNAGETVFVEMWAQTTDPDGLAQVTADISFDAVALDATALTHSAIFNTFTSGTIDNVAGLVDDAGGSHFSPGCVDQTGFAPNWVRVATIQMTAVAGGLTTVQAADSANAVFTVAICNLIAAPTVTYGAVTFTIFSNCGNGIIDPGETCDDGNTQNGDCCSAVCQLDPFLTPCDADADLCTLDICLAGGTCVPTGSNVNCPPPGVCTGGGACNPATGLCDTVPDPPLGTPCVQDTDPCTTEECDGFGACVFASFICADTANVAVVALASQSPGDTAATLPTSQTDFPTGAPVFVEMWAQTANAAGLTQASTDISFNPAVLSAVTITHSALFSFLPNGTIDNVTGLIDDLSGIHFSGGGCDGTAFAPNWGRVAVIEMTPVAGGASPVIASATGNVNFSVSICGGVEPPTTYSGTSIAISGCGNGILEALEQCDDGNVLNGDCCSSTCTLDAAGVSCNVDGDLCTTDTCNGNGVCVFQSNVTCAPPVPPCEAGQTCNSATGACDNVPDAGAGILCDLDADLCTIDTCDGLGACVATGTNVTCLPPVPPCEAGELCDAATGGCVAQTDAAAGTPCDLDTNLCTIDQCDGLGTCLATGTNVTCLPPVPPCEAGEVCDIATGQCNALADAPLGTNCDLDATLCTIDQCDGAGACVSTGTNVTCQPPALPCEAGESCVAATGACVALPDALAGTPCQGDGSFCTIEACDGFGSCVFQSNVTCAPPVPPCEAGEACTPATGLCDPQPDAAAGTPCEADSDLCTIDACNGAGLCVLQSNVTCAPPVPPCEAGEACTPATGLCDPLQDAAIGTPCEAEGNLCTIDACDGAGLCVFQSNVTCAPPVPPCEAGEACISATGLCSPLTDTAAGTSCEADGNLCTLDACDGFGLCVFQSNAVCPPAVPPCEGGTVCNSTTGACDPLPDAPSTTSCEADGNLCTIDACNGAGSCVFQSNVACAPAVPPCEGGETCDTTTGACVPQADAPFGITCEGDGNLCTQDHCDGVGNCVAFDLFCPDVCQNCEPAVGACQWCIFDHDFDGLINGLDFAFFSFCFGACYPPGHQCSATNYDQDPNNCTSGGDFAGFSGCFSLNCTTCPNCFPIAGGGPNPIPPTSSERDAVVEAAVRLVAVGSPTKADVAQLPPASSRSFGLDAPVFIEVWATRAGAETPDASGLASVYVDLLYDPAVLAADEIVPGELFTTFSRGAVDAQGRVSTAGGCAPLGTGTLGVDPQWVRVTTVKMHAIDSGIAVVTIENAESPFGLSVFGRLGNLPASHIESQAITIDLIDRPRVDLQIGQAATDGVRSR